MVVDSSFPLTSKRRRVLNIYSVDKLADMTERFGRVIRVFETLAVSPSPTAAGNNGEETDDFYEFTAEDYHRILATKKEDKFLKTRKIREAEEAARRSRITKAVIRVRFPDNHTLEVIFHPSETIQSLIDLLTKVIAKPEQPFYIYTTPPKKLIKDMSQDFYTAGFCPGAIVYFSYDVPKGDGTLVSHVGPYLCEEVMSLKGLDIGNVQGQPSSEPVQSAPESVEAAQHPAVEERKPADKKLVKPKWLKIIRGDQQHFVRRDELKASWEIFTPLLHRIDKGEFKSIPYQPGSRGPAEVDELLEKVGYVQTHGYIWISPTL